jgi:tetratricopeptide (TPR) repeat protein
LSPQRFDLADVRADGWLDQVAAETPEFAQLTQVIGRRFVAFSFVVGARLVSVSYDPSAPHASLVEFAMSDQETQTVPLSEFRERLGALLLAGSNEQVELSSNPSHDELRRFIGARYLLLAPLFGIHLKTLVVASNDEPVLEVELGGGQEQIVLHELREALHSAIRAEVARVRPSGSFSIDFNKVPMAESANQRGNYDETIALLGAWPGPLSMFLRSPQGAALGQTERGKLVRALGALGEAYLHTQQADWAEDVLRLGIQFGQELDTSARLFGLLGRTRVELGRPGEAIGLLRRALDLGADPVELLPDLARCFAERKRYVAAAACLDEAERAGVEPDTLAPLRGQVAEALGPAYGRYRSWMEGSR